MRTQPTTRLPGAVVSAAVLLAIKASLGIWGGYVLVSASRAHHRSFLGETISTAHRNLGWALVTLAAVSLVMAVALVRAAPWARLGVFALETVGAVLALSRLVSHPRSSVVSLALSAVIVALVVMRSSARALGPVFPGPRAMPRATSG
jgi:hypothetical protein